ncbi:MAG: dTMP kinase [Aquificaceae bacterium]|nr:dTMP kinase [Aquificaceae bacterium]MCS7195644.1 dTMP kinase [Aquificaceae bacterium]MCX7990378.1 dTMP kinase [Aquificaceae bacterium]MDW8032576.1 dTMP kinase [Aquificaceae bacterium]MDW8294898.1 dTMP kinase [Aquificaceae bacterium]
MLLSFEGIDGSGKSTQARKLYEHIKGLGYPVSLYRDPGSTELAERIRELVLNFEMDPTTELLLFETARSSLVWERIFPDLKEGKIVILDRFIDSTTAYQGYGREINLGTVSVLNHIAIRGRKPDLTFLLNIPLELALQRIGQKKTRFENKEYLKRVRDAYLLIAHQERERFVLLDGTKEEEELFVEVLRFLRERFGLDL